MRSGATWRLRRLVWAYPAFAYFYDLAGELTQENYPSGRQVKNSYDAAGRAIQVQGVQGSNTTTYANNIVYAPQGPVQSLTLGNGVQESWTFGTPQLQPTQLVASLSGTGLGTWSWGYGSATADNGNVMSAGINISAGEVNASQSFTYDALNRLKTANEGAWRQTYVYDRFGNRAVLAGAAPIYIPGTSWTPQVSSDTPAAAAALFTGNRWSGTGVQYDGGTANGAGNTTALPGFGFSYDAENRMVTATPSQGAATTYVYDGDGRRVQKVTGSSTTTYVYDAAGSLAAEYATQPAAAPCTTCYLTEDTLGSTRMMTDRSGAIKSLHDYLPFGEEIQAGLGSRSSTYYPPNSFAINDGTTQKFTGKERDQETGLDFFQARYFGSSQGRFTSPDPGPWILLNPQSYNAYSYGLNNPLRYGDEDGLTPQDRINQANNLLGMNIPYSHQQSYISNPAEGLDCSGLAANVFHADPDNNVALTHNAAAQAAAFEAHGEFTTDVSQGQPGDAIYWSDSSGHIAHTGIVVDIRDGKIYFVHAPRPGKNVNKFWVPLSTGKLGNERFAGFGRPIEHPRNGRPQRVAAPGFRDVIEMLWMMYGPSSPNSEKPKKKKHKKLIPRGTQAAGGDDGSDD